MAYSAFGYRKVEQSLQKDATELSKQRCTEQIHRNTSGQACPWHIEQQLQDYAQYLCWALIFSAGLCFQEGSCCGGGDRGWDKAKPLNAHPQTSLCRFFRGDDGWVQPVPNTFWTNEAVSRASVDLG